jgi:hypothetical protein
MDATDIISEENINGTAFLIARILLAAIPFTIGVGLIIKGLLLKKRNRSVCTLNIRAKCVRYQEESTPKGVRYCYILETEQNGAKREIACRDFISLRPQGQIGKEFDLLVDPNDFDHIYTSQSRNTELAYIVGGCIAISVGVIAFLILSIAHLFDQYARSI